MIASVSSDAPDNRWGRAASCARSIASVYSALVRICQPPPTSTSSTPWPALLYVSRSSSRADCSAAGDASGSRAASSSSGIGRALAKSAASSSLARGFTTDQNGGEGCELCEPELASARELQQREQCREHLPWLGSRRAHVAPSRGRAQREDGTHGRDRTIDIERASDNVMDDGLSGNAQHAIGRREQLGERKRERRRGRSDLLRHVRARESAATLFSESLEDIHHLAHLLVLEQSPHELSARVFPRVIELVARQQHLRLDAEQSRGHLEIVGRLVELHEVDAREELLGNARDRDVIDVDLFVANERQQEIERTAELRQLDDERRRDVRHRLEPAWLDGGVEVELPR